MRYEIREVPTVEKQMYYIADDGTEFRSQRECADYEFQQEVNKRQLEWKSCQELRYGLPSKLWYIKSKDEFIWLSKTEWCHASIDGYYKKEGWYIAIRHDGGDYYDEVEVIPFDEYIAEFEKDLNELKNLTSN